VSTARKTKATLLATIAILSSLAATGRPAYAGTGFNHFWWADSGITLSQTSYKYSNMSAFWQAIVNADGCNIPVDGVYGPTTTWYTATFQNHLFSTNNGGVMTPGWLNYFQLATDTTPGHYPRLRQTGFIDGYGTVHYGYYAGQESFTTELGWNPISAQWLFSQYPISNPHALIPATPSRTVGSVSACA